MIKEFFQGNRNRLYSQMKDNSLLTERWTGRRIKPGEAAELSGIGQTGFAADFEPELHRLAAGGNYEHLYPDLCRADPRGRGIPAHRLLKRTASEYTFLKIENANVRRLRTIKQPCELDAMRQSFPVFS